MVASVLSHCGIHQSPGNLSSVGFFVNRLKMPRMTSKSCLACLEELYHVCSSNSYCFRSGFCGLTLGLVKASSVTGLVSGVMMKRRVAISRDGVIEGHSFPFVCFAS